MIPPPLPPAPHPTAMLIWYDMPAVIFLNGASAFNSDVPIEVRHDYKDIWWHYISSLSSIDLDEILETFDW